MRERERSEMLPDVKSKAGDALFQQYEAMLERTKVMAFIANVMYGLNWFLGFCALTWASAVILGGLLTSLSQHDYYSVVVLLLLEAVRLSTVTFFGKFVTWKLIHGSVDPERLVYNDARRQKFQGIARIPEQAVQLTVIAISILVPIRRLRDLHSLNAATTLQAIQINDFDGLETSLRIFYVLVLVNGAIAGLAVIFSKNVVPFFVYSFSLRKYYEKIVWKGMDEGLLHATDFELLSWTFQMQADEYRRNTRAVVVKELYGDMMKFLYYHPRHKGFEAAKVALESADTFEREAAANIVGLWVALAADVEESDHKSASSSADVEESDHKSASSSTNPKKLPEKRTLARLLIQARLLAKLAEALDSDESGRAATLSFEKLAETDPEGVLMVRSAEKDQKVADILMDRIHRAVELEKPDNAIIYIKAMIPLMTIIMKSKEDQNMTAGNGHGIGEYCTAAKLERLEGDMSAIVSNGDALKRVQVVAAHVYCLLCKDKGMLEKLLTHVMEMPKRKSHILKDEVELFLKLPGVAGREWPSKWNDVVEVRPINMKESKPPLPWLASPTTALIATLVTLFIIAVSSIFIMRNAHF